MPNIMILQVNNIECECVLPYILQSLAVIQNVKFIVMKMIISTF